MYGQTVQEATKQRTELLMGNQSLSILLKNNKYLSNKWTYFHMWYLLGDPQYVQDVPVSERVFPAVARSSKHGMKFHQDKVCRLIRLRE